MATEKYSVFDQMLEGVQVIAKDGRYLYVNDAVVRQSKLTRELLVGSTMTERYPGIERTEVFARMQECIRTRRSFEWVNEFDFPDSTKGFFQLRMHPVPEGVLIMSYDITEQKKAEQLIKSTNAYLEEIVKTRTGELRKQNAIIEKQLEHLKELNTTKDKFFSIIAHDLVSPLNSLKGLSDLMTISLKKIGKEDISEITQRMEKSVEHTIKLTKDLVTWARVQMNSEKTVTEKVDVTEILAEVCGLYKDLAERKGIKLTYNGAENLFALGDRDQIAFIIRNLVSNAIKYTYPGGEVKVHAESLPNLKIKISVMDTGVGISEDVKRSIYKLQGKFQGTKSSEGTGGEKGTGLGLILCQEFVQLNKGKIEIESGEGTGTRFHVFLNANTPDLG